ncbi:hypothetical protein [Kineococcus sp. SYSU DK003]|uniref:hypothetical protein n=1 Tax=Kineococcus sp. SYSU DK003 TaxID=3383124 RepID=UPI003D7D0998
MAREQQVSAELGRGIAALVVTAVEVGHDELEARRQVGAFLHGLALPGATVLREAVAAVVDLAPAEMREASGEAQLLAALEARVWLERMTADVDRGVPL